MSYLKQDEISETRSPDEKEEIIAALRNLQPQTPLGERLIQMSLRGLEEGVAPLPVDELLAYLGHEVNEREHSPA